MSVRPDPVIPETRRRRASTTEKSERILKMSRSLTLTRSVLAGTLAEATPNQLDFIERWFTAELDSRERSKRLRLLKQAGFPADKTLDGYDWTNLKMPADWGRAQLENLDFVAGCEDLVLYGPVGTGKSHLAIAIGRLACERGVPVRFFTATGLLMRLRRAQQENRLDRELASIGKARLLIIDEFGYLPIDEEGSRLLFQIISDSYETRSIIYTTNIEFSGWGRVLGDKNMAAALIDRTVHHGRSSDSRAAPTEANTPHDQITNTTQTGSGRYRTPCGKPAAYTAEKHRSQSGRQLAKTQACRRPVRPPAAEILMTLTTTAAATVVTAALPAAAGASEHAPAWTHADLEHGPERSGESVIRTSSTTVPLTLRSCLNMPFIRRLPPGSTFFLVDEHPTQKTPPQRLNDEPPPTKTAIGPKNRTLSYCYGT